MLKKLLKSIFPVIFLKKAFLIVNTIKIKTLDRILFPKYKPLPEEVILNIETTPFKQFNADQLSDERVRKYMKCWETWQDQEFIIAAKQGIIEPKYGWLIQKRKLNYFSLGISRNSSFIEKPSFISLLKKNKVVELSSCISLRDPGEENYFHFYNDVIAKLIFLRNYGYDLAKYPIVIADKLWQKPYFKFYYQRTSFLQTLNWHIQKDELVKAEQVILCKPFTHRKDIFDQIVNWLGIENVEIERERKIFITRSKNRLRFIENEIEVKTVCEELGFEIVDADSLNLEEQISLFRQTRWLAGIHGAGFTNIMYRKGLPMNMLEIFPPPQVNYLPFHYIMLAQMYGINYDAMIGEKAAKKYSGGFYINPALLKKQMEKLLRDE